MGNNTKKLLTISMNMFQQKRFNQQHTKKFLFNKPKLRKAKLSRSIFKLKKFMWRKLLLKLMNMNRSMLRGKQCNKYTNKLKKLLFSK